MSETPAKPTSSPDPDPSPQRLTFSTLQSQAALEAGRVQELSQKCINALNEKILESSNKAAELKKELSFTNIKITSFQKEIKDLEKAAQDDYTNTLNIILNEFDLPEPPWTATVILEKGTPIGADLVKTEADS